MVAWASIVTGLLSGTANAIITDYTNHIRINALNEAKQNINKAVNQYTGKNANTANNAMAAENAARLNGLSQGIYTQGKQNTAMANAAEGADKAIDQNVANEGFNQGYNISDTQNKAKLANTIAQENAKVKQANIEADALQQGVQSGLNVAGGLADLSNQTGLSSAILSNIGSKWLPKTNNNNDNGAQ